MAGLQNLANVSGTNDYITKPFDPELLKRKLMHCIYG